MGRMAAAPRGWCAATGPSLSLRNYPARTPEGAADGSYRAECGVAGPREGRDKRCAGAGGWGRWLLAIGC